MSAALQRMAAELAHELRNPLGGIRLHAGLLAEDLEGTEHAAMIDRILVGVASLEAAIAGMLQFTEPREGRADRTADLGEVVAETAGFVQLSCRLQDVDLRCRADGSFPVPLGREPLRQVVLNLLTNALDACDSGDTIDLEIERDDAGVRLTCRDGGSGISADDLPHVFEPYFTRSPQGQGLGLAIVRRTVEACGGSIRLDSAPGCGTTAVVRLPHPAEEADR